MLLNKIILLAFALFFKPFNKNKNLWVYIGTQNNSVLPLLKYAKKTDHRKHIYITPFKTHIAELRKQGILAFKPSSLLGYYYTTRAKIIVTGTNSNLGGLGAKYLTNGKLIINVFHGIPIKKIVIERYNHKDKKHPKSLARYRIAHVNRKQKRLKRKFDRQIFLCATSELTQQLFAPCFGVDKEKLPIVGEPRNDILYSNTTNRDYLVKHISHSIQNFTTIFAYTPTWRDGEIWDTGIDFEKMNSFLLKYNCALIIRPHHFDKTFSDLDGTHSNIFISNSYSQEYNDAYNELVGVDVLISDYSSLIFEFLITNRPVLVYTPDYQHYKEMRGFLIKFDTHIPSNRLNNHQDLIQAMLNVINGDYDKNRYNKIRNMFHKYQDANSSKRVYDEINSRLQ